MALTRLPSFTLLSTDSYTFGNANVTGNAVVGNILTDHLFYANGVAWSFGSTYSNSNVAAYLPTYTGNIGAGNANVTGTLAATSITTSGSGGNISGANFVIANYFQGNGSLLTSLNASNITGQVSNSVLASTVYTNAQPNITSVGTLTSLNVTNDVVIGGNLTVSGTQTTVNSTTVNVNDVNIVLANNATTQAQANGGGITINGANASFVYLNASNAFSLSHPIIANGSLLTNITGANVSGYVPLATAANTAATVTTNAQPNITSVGTLTSLTVSGLITATGNIKAATVQGTDGTTVLQTNYATKAGDLGVTGNIVAGTGGSGNVTATYFIGNGSQLTGIVAGTTYANSNVAAYLPTYTGNLTAGNLSVSAITNLGSNSNVKITGGTSGQVLSTDGAGNLSWASATGFVAKLDTFTGNSVQTQFTLSSTPTNANYIIVAAGGVVQPHTAYTLSGSTLTFSSAPPAIPIEVTTMGGTVASGGGGASASTVYGLSIVFGNGF